MLTIEVWVDVGWIARPEKRVKTCIRGTHELLADIFHAVPCKIGPISIFNNTEIEKIYTDLNAV